MRIAMFTDCFLPSVNGVVTSITNFSKRLSDNGHEVIIFTSEINRRGKKITKFGRNISVRYHKSVNIIKYPDFQLTMPSINITKELKKFKPDIIHSHQPSLLGWQALIYAKAMKIPIVSTYHTFLPDFVGYFPVINRMNTKFSNKIVWSYTRSYYNLCDMIVTPSLVIKKELVKQGLKRPIDVISNGVNLDKFKSLQPKKNGSTLLYVGRISYEKNVHEVIEAFKIAARYNHSARLMIAGDGPDMDRIKASAGKYLGDRIHFLGSVKHDDLPKLYSSADIFVTASTIETEGIVILEAMACGLPVIGVNKLAIPYIVKHGKNGLISKAHYVKGISKHMISLLNDNKKRMLFSKEAVISIKGYSLDKTAKKLETMYSSLLKNNAENLQS